jgi:hypothetical protein
MLPSSCARWIRRTMLFVLALVGSPFLVCAAETLQPVALPETPQTSKMPEAVRGIYVPPQCMSERQIAFLIHYSQCCDFNAMVLHVKEPHGYLMWKSANKTALEIGAVKGNGNLERALKQLKAAGFWTAAKVDVFQDDALAKAKPDWAVHDSKTNLPWQNKTGLRWVNPYDKRVWDYVVSLAEELVKMGFDEIQFDYVRFPSDGVMERITYPNAPANANKDRTIGAFAEYANKRLKPLGATLSADIFGLTAWKDEFGVGQNIRVLLPHLDVISPMLYPSHFHDKFLNGRDPDNHPFEIMEKSMQHLDDLTSGVKIGVRPWVQGFWYEPDKITAQIKGLEKGGCRDFLVWNPAGQYAKTIQAFEIEKKTKFPMPVFYDSLEKLRVKPPRVVRAGKQVVNYTDFRAGYTILNLAPRGNDDGPNYNDPLNVIQSLDEAVLDRILTQRGKAPGLFTLPDAKARDALALFLKDLKANPRRLNAKPVYVDWSAEACRFTYDVPAAPKREYGQACNS